MKQCEKCDFYLEPDGTCAICEYNLNNRKENMEVEHVTYDQFLIKVAEDVTEIAKNLGKGDLLLVQYQLGHLAAVLKCKGLELQAEDEEDESEDESEDEGEDHFTSLLKRIRKCNQK